MAKPIPQSPIRLLTLGDFQEISIDLINEEVLVNVGLHDENGARVKVVSARVPFTKTIATAIKDELSDGGALLASIHTALGFPD